jgi:hypothetical protein
VPYWTTTEVEYGDELVASEPTNGGKPGRNNSAKKFGEDWQEKGGETYEDHLNATSNPEADLIADACRDGEAGVSPQYHHGTDHCRRRRRAPLAENNGVEIIELTDAEHLALTM